MEKVKMNEDVLFLALTRPAMIFGIPVEAFAMCCAIGGLALRTRSSTCPLRSPCSASLA